LDAVMEAEGSDSSNFSKRPVHSLVLAITVSSA
jgi:hypothetical protein